MSLLQMQIVNCTQINYCVKKFINLYDNTTKSSF